jgi:serine protease
MTVWAWARLLMAGLCLSAPTVQALPWHLGVEPKGDVQVRSSASDFEPEPDVAPAAINTAGMKAGPHPVVVAVIDSGVIAEHPSLEGRLLPGYDMQSLPANIRGGRSNNFGPDPLGTRCAARATSGNYRIHGTEVTSLIAGNGHYGVWGVNPQARILPIRLMGACGMSRADLLDAIRWAAGLPVDGVPDNPHPARVINLSLAGGSSTCTPALQSLVDQIVARGVFMVAAAGNNFQKPLAEPANCAGVIAVGAVDAENRTEVYSALDPRIHIYAPGGGKLLNNRKIWGINKLRVATFDLDILGRERPSAMDRGVGTSYAAPLVSGFISLWLSHQPQKTLAHFWKELPQFLREVPPVERCSTCTLRSLAANTALIKP